MKSTPFDKVEFWDENVRANGRVPASSGYSEYSHERRLKKISELMSRSGRLQDLRVVDIACGVGLLDEACGPFRSYDGIDFSIEACKVASVGRTQDRKIVHGSVLDPDAIGQLRECDWAVACGIYALGFLFENSQTCVSLTKDLLKKSRIGAVVNFPWAAVPPAENLVKGWHMDDVVEAFVKEGLCIEMHVGYLTHEFMMVVTETR